MSQTTTTVKNNRPLTRAEIEARRANAAKSTGPKTPQGKARSSRNALKHGFFAQTALLYYESPEDYVALRDAYIAEYEPQGPTEMHFVMEMANAQFRLRRVRGMEADLIQKSITRDVCASGLSSGEVQAEAFRTLADTSDVLHILQRYEVMFRRQYERALRLLWEHRDRRRRQSESARPAARSPRSLPNPEALKALHALLLAPVPEETENLRNEPEPEPSPFPATTSPLSTGPSAPPPAAKPPKSARPAPPHPRARR